MWQWVFAQQNRWVDERTGEQGRQHVHESIIHKAVKPLVRPAVLTNYAETIQGSATRRQVSLRHCDQAASAAVATRFLPDPSGRFACYTETR